jgi:hypothetical protein
LYGYCRRQGCVAQSSAEAEWYGGASVCSESLLIVKVLAFFGVIISHVNLCFDSSGAEGIGRRLGVGRIRHLETKSLWLQALVKAKLVRIHKVDGERNCADIGTKAHPRDRLELLMHLCSAVRVDLDQFKACKAVAAVITSTGATSASSLALSLSASQIIFMTTLLSLVIPARSTKLSLNVERKALTCRQSFFQGLLSVDFCWDTKGFDIPNWIVTLIITLHIVFLVYIYIKVSTKGFLPVVEAALDAPIEVGTSIGCQSQCTYRRDLQQPRFQVVPEAYR